MSNLMHHDNTKPVPETKAGAPQALRNWTSLREEMDRLFDAYFVAPFGRMDMDRLRRLGGFGRGDGLAPEFDVKDTGDALVVTAELAGMDQKDVTVTVRGDLLVVSGEKKAETTEEKADYLVSERSFGTFTRSFRLPETADGDKVAASFAKGVLTVTVPKRPEAVTKDRTVKITGG